MELGSAEYIAISDADQLLELIEAINDGDRAAAGGNYILTGNINLRGKKIDPIGASESTPFTGVPAALPEEYGYTFYMPQGYNAAAQVCGNPKIEGRDVYLYLTNPIQNPCQMRAEVFTVKAGVDSSGKQTFLPDKLLGRTGFIHPGTYVEKVTLDKELSDGDTPVYIKIALRDDETGQSLGSFLVGTTLHK